MINITHTSLLRGKTELSEDHVSSSWCSRVKTNSPLSDLLLIPQWANHPRPCRQLCCVYLAQTHWCCLRSKRSKFVGTVQQIHRWENNSSRDLSACSTYFRVLNIIKVLNVLLCYLKKNVWVIYVDHKAAVAWVYFFYNKNTWQNSVYILVCNKNILWRKSPRHFHVIILKVRSRKWK